MVELLSAGELIVAIDPRALGVDLGRAEALFAQLPFVPDANRLKRRAQMGGAVAIPAALHAEITDIIRGGWPRTQQLAGARHKGAGGACAGRVDLNWTQCGAGAVDCHPSCECPSPTYLELDEWWMLAPMIILFCASVALVPAGVPKVLGLNIYSALGMSFMAVSSAVAFAFSTLWDNIIASHGVWTYNAECMVGVYKSIPYEEYACFMCPVIAFEWYTLGHIFLWSVYTIVVDQFAISRGIWHIYPGTGIRLPIHLFGNPGMQLEQVLVYSLTTPFLVLIEYWYQSGRKQPLLRYLASMIWNDVCVDDVCDEDGATDAGVAGAGHADKARARSDSSRTPPATYTAAGARPHFRTMGKVARPAFARGYPMDITESEGIPVGANPRGGNYMDPAAACRRPDKGADAAHFLLMRIIRDGRDKRFDKVRDKPGTFLIFWLIRGGAPPGKRVGGCAPGRKKGSH
eukprot:gene54604-22459_t